MKTFSSKNVQCEVKTISLTFTIYCLSLEPELVLFLHLISPCSWGIVWISSYYCLWYLMLILLSLSWFCACTWYLLAAGVLFWYNVSGILMPIQLSPSWFCACTWYLLAAGVLFWYHLILLFLVSDANINVYLPLFNLLFFFYFFLLAQHIHYYQ